MRIPYMNSTKCNKIQRVKDQKYQFKKEKKTLMYSI